MSVKALSAAMAAILLTASVLGAAEPGPGPLGLAATLDLARSGPDVRAAREQASEAGDAADAHWRAAYLPKLLGGVVWEHTDRDLQMEVFPLGALDLGQDGWMGGAVAQQPILDVESMVYGVRASRRTAQAAELKAQQAERDNQTKALGYYLQALELRAQRRALEQYARNLTARGDEIQRLYELGGVGEADLLKVKLGADDARAGARELAEKEDLLARLLAQTLGLEGVRTPEDLPENLPDATAPAARPEDRSDLKALGRQIEAAEAAEAGVEADFLPKVSASVSYVRSDQDLLNQQEWCGLGAQATWTLFDGAVRQARASAAAHEAAALKDKRAAALQGLAAQAHDAAAMLKIKRQEYAERLQAVVEAERAAKLEFERLQRGRVTMNNLIDAEDVLKDRREKADLAKVQWWEQWFQGQAAAGAPLSLP